MNFACFVLLIVFAFSLTRWLFHYPAPLDVPLIHRLILF